MRAILLAAGRGLRLQPPAEAQLPKCLLAFGGRTLLQRHLRLLQAAGVSEVVLAVGYRHEDVRAHLAQIAAQPRFSLKAARRLAAIVSDHVDSGRAALPHEEAVRDLLREASQPFEMADVTGEPWIEIDFAADVVRARDEILPRL